jgi:hypothetical protein
MSTSNHYNYSILYIFVRDIDLEERHMPEGEVVDDAIESAAAS